MMRAIRRAAAVAALALLLTGGTASAQKAGGILRVYSPDSPPGLSIYEQATPWGQGPLMSVYNNLILFDQHIAQNRLEIPSLVKPTFSIDRRGRNFPAYRGLPQRHFASAAGQG